MLGSGYQINREVGGHYFGKILRRETGAAPLVENYWRHSPDTVRVRSECSPHRLAFCAGGPDMVADKTTLNLGV